MFASALVMLSAIAPPLAQTAQPGRFRSGIELLTLDVAVTDSNGSPVTNLQADDFVVSVGGQPRKVLFARFLGAGGGARASAGRDPSVAHISNTATASGRHVLFVIDRDSIQSGAEKSLLTAVGGVLDALGPADAAGVVGLPSGRFELTREHERIRRLLSLMTGTMPSTGWRWHITWEEAEGIERQDARLLAQVLDRECRPGRPSDAGGPPRVAEGCDRDVVTQAREMLTTARARTRTTLENLGAIAGGLAHIHGPKHLVFISGGLRFDQELLLAFTRFAEQAARAGLVLHVIHADQPASDSTTARRVVTPAFGGRDMTAGLTAIAGTTGGAYFQGVGSAAGAFDRIATAITNTYQLALETTAADASAGVRDVKVSVARTGLRVRTGAAIALSAPPAPAGDALAQLLEQPADITALPIEIATYTSRGDDPERLRVTIAGAVATGDAALNGEWGFIVLSEGNVVASGRRKVAEAVSGGWPITASALLAPGRYRLRFAALAGDGRGGTLDVPLQVGLRHAGELQASDLILGVASGGRLQPRARVPAGADLHALIEVMSSNVERLARARAVIEIIPGGTAEPVQRHLMAVRSGAIPTILLHEARLNTSALSPGRYTASVTVVVDETPLGRIIRVFEVVAGGAIAPRPFLDPWPPRPRP